MDRRAWWATAYRVAKNPTRLSTHVQVPQRRGLSQTGVPNAVSPISHYCLLVGDIFWFWGLSLSAVCLDVSRGKGDPCSLLECWGRW